MTFERIAPEQHDTLEGIPEPAENPLLFGQDEAAGMLATAYRAGKLPHGLLFVGPQGIGKATLAFHLTYHLLKHPDFRAAPGSLDPPDPTSPLFRQVALAAHPSVLRLTRPFDEKRKLFKTVLTVDEIRKIRNFIGLTSHDAGWRIVIVDPADDMNRQAANALLKGLEEPPAKTVFILIAHSPGSLLPTIRSRCQVVRLSPLSAEDLAVALAGAGAPLPESETERAALAARAGGSVRAAIQLAEHGGLEIAEATERLAIQRELPVIEAHKLADSLVGRDQAIQFGIFNQHALDLLAGAASRFAFAGELARAKILSDTWHEAANAISEVEAYNLDRKQHVLIMLDRLNAAMRM